jgi:murein L,D-transpeptidase YafK
MRNLTFSVFLGLMLAVSATGSVFSQTSVSDVRKYSIKFSDIFARVEDSLKKEFKSKNLAWPPKDIYIRSFKYDRQLEVWVKDNLKEQFKLFKTYRVCMQSGTMGPKRMQGDYQVPEGFYYIDEFNPNSNYHLSLGLNYPNSSDRILSDANRPGGEIYIHGNCVSVGCIPIDDGPIEELYVLASIVKESGSEFIPVHVYPVRYNVKKSFEYLAQATKENQALQQFDINLKTAYDYFEEKKELPIILVNKKGDYVIQ